MESTQPILRCRYSYDPLDRLISQLQPDAPAHQRFYCKSRLATEIQGAIGLSVFQNNDLLLAQRKNQGGAVESTLLATDLQRSVLHTLTADQQQHTIAYSPYGHRQAESGLTSLLGFNGERPDPVTGHCLLGNGYRAFNPVLMRFNSPDSLSPFGEGGFNSYAYCLGDPTNKNDHSGRIATKVIAGIFSHWLKRTKATQASTTNITTPRTRIPRARLITRESASPQMINTQPSRPTNAIQATPPPYSSWDPLGSIESINEYGIPVSVGPPPGYFKLSPPVSFHRFPANVPVDEPLLPLNRLPRSFDDTPNELLTTHLRTSDEINTRYDELRLVSAERRRIRAESTLTPARHK